MKGIKLSRLDEITRTIRIEHAEFELSLRNSMERAIHIGKLLGEAKELVKHGEWGKWIEDNCRFGERTAQNFMRLHSKYPEIPKAQLVADLNYKEALALLSEPKKPELEIYPNCEWMEKLQWANREANEILALKDLIDERSNQPQENLRSAQKLLQNAQIIAWMDEMETRAVKYASTFKEAMLGCKNDEEVYPHLSSEIRDFVEATLNVLGAK